MKKSIIIVLLSILITITGLSIIGYNGMQKKIKNEDLKELKKAIFSNGYVKGYKRCRIEDHKTYEEFLLQFEADSIEFVEKYID